MPVSWLPARPCNHPRHWHLHEGLVRDEARRRIHLDIALTVGGKEGDLEDLARSIELRVVARPQDAEATGWQQAPVGADDVPE